MYRISSVCTIRNVQAERKQEKKIEKTTLHVKKSILVEVTFSAAIETSNNGAPCLA